MSIAAAAVMLACLPLRPCAQDKQGRADAEKEKASIEASIQKDPENAELWTKLGYAWRKLKNVDEAQRAFEKAVELSPKNLKAQFMLGLIYEKKKLKEKAVAAWKACLDSPDPNVRDVAAKHLHHLENK